MSVISKMTVTQDAALVILRDVPANFSCASEIFDALEEAKINIDMIAQSPLVGPYFTLFFSANGEDVGKISAIVQQMRKTHACIRPLINYSNVKISLYGKDMHLYPGVAAEVFRLVREYEGDVLFYTSSATDISLLISRASAENCIEIFQQHYNL